jgi:hypothetical protein
MFEVFLYTLRVKTGVLNPQFAANILPAGAFKLRKIFIPFHSKAGIESRSSFENLRAAY